MAARGRGLSRAALPGAARTLKSDLYLGAVYVRLMQQSTEDITAPWLLPEMVSRVAHMLDYFLDHLAGPRPRL